ncbi:MAG: hypothetical protein K2O03_02370 [Lachnospiraceae bacterium]|nr:hypothetical protein [Lachnospiraceae bacterium]
MLTTMEIRDWIAGLGVTEAGRVYIGKLDNKQQKAIGVYGREVSGFPITALGGTGYSTYNVRHISLLVHWTKRQEESEEVAYYLFRLLQGQQGFTAGKTRVLSIQLQMPEPQPIGTDETGVYEFVIWLDFIYERKDG